VDDGVQENTANSMVRTARSILSWRERRERLEAA
jgi:hypothetical protein